jgi:hypothetical protein
MYVYYTTGDTGKVPGIKPIRTLILKDNRENYIYATKIQEAIIINLKMFEVLVWNWGPERTEKRDFKFGFVYAEV